MTSYIYRTQRMRILHSLDVLASILQLKVKTDYSVNQAHRQAATETAARNQTNIVYTRCTILHDITIVTSNIIK